MNLTASKVHRPRVTMTRVDLSFALFFDFWGEDEVEISWINSSAIKGALPVPAAMYL